MKIASAAKQTVGTLAAVAVPAFGGQLVSAVAKAKAPGLVGGLPDIAVDAGGGVIASALTLGVAYALGGKAAAMRAIPFVGAGLIMGVALPKVDDVIDGAVKAAVGAGGAAPAALPAAGANAKPGGFRVVPGGALGATLPGGSELGGTLPGGREGVSSVRAFSAGGQSYVGGTLP